MKTFTNYPFFMTFTAVVDVYGLKNKIENTLWPFKFGGMVTGGSGNTLFTYIVKITSFK